MKEDAESKARRRRNLRESFPVPLNQIALRHVDSVRALDESRQIILAKALAQVGVVHVANCLATMKSSGDSIKNENDLIATLNRSEIPRDRDVDGSTDAQDVEAIDIDHLASLLIRSYPDMPQATADALVGSEVMASCLRVVSTTRLALGHARSDFVITVLYTLFEEKLDEIEQIISSNPAFVKAMQLSRPDWKPN
jgi:hypothetical protein